MSLLNYTKTLNTRKYNPSRTLDYFNQPAKIYQNANNPIPGEICDTSYRELLEDYKDKIIADFKANGLEKAAVMWNCDDGLLKSLLVKWGYMHEFLLNMSPEDIESIIFMYKSGQSCPCIAKKFKCSEGTIRRLLKKHGIKIRHDYFNLNFVEIWNNSEKEKALVDYYLGHGGKATAEHYKMSEPLVIRVLKKYKVNGQYKKNNYRKIRNMIFRQGELAL
jgi:transposase